MEQETEGKGGGELGGAENKQPQPQPQPQPPPPQQQPQQHHQCPRCDSLNTKFCYYNNYSLSQPRYFCKACKRYWTKGGTLRNIPIGGGNRSKTFSSSTMNSSRSQPQLQPQLQSATQEVVQNQPNLTNLMRHTAPTVVQSTSPYYQGGGVGGGGYLSSLAAVHSLNPSSQPFKQSLNVGVGDLLASSNSGFLSAGFNTVASLGSQHHHRSQIRPSRFNQIGNRDREVESLLRAEQGYSIPSSMTNSSAASHSDHWPQSFTDNANHRASDASLWSTISTTSISGNTQNNIRGGSSSFIQNHWPNLPGYGFPE